MKIDFRTATLEDAHLLFDWRNDPETRLNSHSTGEVSFTSHYDWLKQALGNPERRLLIAEQEGQAVGTVRLDQEAEGVFVLSWSVAPEARGRGIASRMVHLIVNEVLPASSVRAEVKAGNEASMKVAKAAGLQPVRQEGGVIYFYKAGTAG